MTGAQDQLQACLAAVHVDDIIFTSADDSVVTVLGLPYGEVEKDNFVFLGALLANKFVLGPGPLRRFGLGKRQPDSM